MHKDFHKDYIQTGNIGKTYKFDGFLYLWSLNSKENFYLAGKVFALKKNSSKLLELQIEEIQDNKDNLLVKFKGFDTREKAKELSGMDILIKREFASSLLQGQVYIQDLIGLKILVSKANIQDKLKDVFSDDIIHTSQEFFICAEIVDVKEGTQSELLYCKLLNLKDKAVNKFVYIPYMKVYLDEPNLKDGIIILKESALLL